MHSAGPIASLNVFTAHGAHAPPFSPVYPGLHWQDVIIVLPAREVASPGHNEHASEPVAVLNWPGAHCAHATPFAPVQPALQVHVLMLVAPISSEPEPAGHIEHAADPGTDLNRPATQSAHAPLSGPVNPALHRHRLRTTPGSGDCEFAGQLAHSAGPIANLNVPTPHGAHTPPFSPVYPGLH